MIEDYLKVRIVGYAIIVLIFLYLYFFRKAIVIKNKMLEKISKEQLLVYEKNKKYFVNFDHVEYFMTFYEVDGYKEIKKINNLLKIVQVLAVLIGASIYL